MTPLVSELVPELVSYWKRTTRFFADLKHGELQTVLFTTPKQAMCRHPHTYHIGATGVPQGAQN